MADRKVTVSISEPGARLTHVPALSLTVAPTIDCQALTQIVDGLARSGRRVPSAGRPADQPRSLQLIATEAYDVWLITWPPGSVLEMHDHGTALGVMRIASGELLEWTAAGAVHLGGERAHVTVPGTAHRLVNPLSTETTSVHAYSPSLREMTYHPELDSRSVHPAGSARTQAEATSPALLYAVR